MVNSQKKGKEGERQVARYLTRRGLAARRHVRTGTAEQHDEGDIRIPGITFEVKTWGRPVTDLTIAQLLTKLDRQRGPGQLGVLVERRSGVSEARAGEWWAHLTVDTWARLHGLDGCRTAPDARVTIHLGTLVTLWLASGRAVLTNPFETGESA